MYFKTIVYGIITPCITLYGINCIIKYTIKDILNDFLEKKMIEIVKDVIIENLDDHVLKVKDILTFKK